MWLSEAFSPEGEPIWRLEVTNLEVRITYRKLFADVLAQGLGDPSRASDLCRAMLTGHIQDFEAYLGELLVNTLSYHDVAGRRPEAVYQAFIAGLLVLLNATHEVSTNREAGRGRYDVLVDPRTPDNAGFVLELKVIDTRREETAQQALDAAVQQLRDRDYAAALRSRGASTIHQWGIVFDGKRVWANALQ